LQQLFSVFPVTVDRLGINGHFWHKIDYPQKVRVQFKKLKLMQKLKMFNIGYTKRNHHSK